MYAIVSEKSATVDEYVDVKDCKLTHTMFCCLEFVEIGSSVFFQKYSHVIAAWNCHAFCCVPCFWLLHFTTL
jgi:hypothetical protein